MTGNFQVAPVAGPVELVIRPPGSKSQTIRALIISSLARGQSRLGDPLVSDDTRHALVALRQLGVAIDDSAETWVVEGSDGALTATIEALNAGESGLTARSLIALAPLIRGRTTIIGTGRLPQRPMGGLIQTLRSIGIEVEAVEDRLLPVTVSGSGRLPGGNLSVPSRETTQYVTGLLMSAPLATDTLVIFPEGMEGSSGYVDVTVQIMTEVGASIIREGDGVRVEPIGYTGRVLDIEPDASAAAYPMVAAAVTGGRASIEGLGSATLQPDMAVADLLAVMGCDLARTTDATTIIGPGGPLHPLDADLSASPDGALALAVACLFADGESRLRGLGSLRHKESDRVTALVTEIRRLGADAAVDGDDLVIIPGRLHGAEIETYGDHRIAMSFALAGLRVPGVVIRDPDVVAKTWPGFWDLIAGMTPHPDLT